MYKRILLKLSGEQLQGEYDNGFSVERAKWIANEIKPLIDESIEVVVMIGGGNYARGSQLTCDEIPRVNADSVGMLATMMNAISLNSVFRSVGLSSQALSNIKADQIVDQFTHRRALSHLQKMRVVVVAGGLGRPFLTTDTAAVALALELGCDVVMKATKVDGVYTEDPMQNPDAKRIESLNYDEALTNESIKIMDKAALGLAMEHRLPIVVFELLKDGNILKVVHGLDVGTTIRL